MKIFKITPEIEVVCDSKKTRMAFKHEATLFRNGTQIGFAKICYQNRTWERFEFQCVAQRVIDVSSLTDTDKKICLDWLEGDHTDWSAFKMTSMVAMMGEVFCDNQKEKNDWKARMIKAGMGNSGLEMPEDWDTLDEDTKQARLDGVIQIMQETGQ